MPRNKNTIPRTAARVRPAQYGGGSCRSLHAALVLGLALALFTLNGCAQKKVIGSTPAPRKERSENFVSRAEQAWRSGDTTRSEAAYGKLLERPGLSDADRATARERFIASAIKNEHFHLALGALNDWLAADHSARNSDFARTAFFDAARGIGRSPEITAKLDAVFSDPAYPAAWRSEAGLILAGHAWNRGNLQTALVLFNELWDQAGQQDFRAFLERGLLREASFMSHEDLQALADMGPSEGPAPFPFSVIQLEQARRLAENQDTWPHAWQILRRLLQDKTMADKDLVSSVLMPLEAERGQPVQGVALLLPLSGPYGGVGWKILRGAGVAQWNLAQQGVEVKVRVLNTATPGWEAELTQMEKGFVVTGGPLRRDVFQTVKSAGLDAGRAVFTFLPSLGDAQEGRDAWRFFSSPRDQVRTLLDLAANELDVGHLAALYPDEPYGRGMTELFVRESANFNATMGPAVAYPPKDHKSWGKIIANMLAVEETPEGEDPMPPSPEFEAVFLPETWSKTQMIVPQFLFNLEERQVFLGTSLWGQSLLTLDSLDERNYRLAVFPSAWWQDNDSPAALELKSSLENEGLGDADYWVALGFDFLRFASLLGPMPGQVTPELINERVAYAQQMPWSMAPLTWDADGVASQSLFVFSASRRGAERINADRLRSRMTQLRRLHDRRVESVTRKREEKLQPLTKPESATPSGTAQGATPGTTQGRSQ